MFEQPPPDPSVRYESAGGDGVESDVSSRGQTVTATPLSGFWARLTDVASSDPLYSWVQQQRLGGPDAPYTDLEGGLFGGHDGSGAGAARETNDRLDVPTHATTGEIVWLTLADDGESFEFAWGGPDAFTVREVDGSPTVAATVIEVNQATGLRVLDQTGGVARLEGVAATPFVWGVVTTAAQDFAGDKGFVDSVRVDKFLDPKHIVFNHVTGPHAAGYALSIFHDTAVASSQNAVFIASTLSGTGGGYGLSVEAGGVSQARVVAYSKNVSVTDVAFAVHVNGVTTTGGSVVTGGLTFVGGLYISGTATGGVADANYGDVTVSGSGTVWNINAGVVGPTELASTAVTPGAYNSANIVVDAQGRLTFAEAGLVATVQNANKIFAGPTTGADALPTFRIPVAADIPSGMITNAHHANMATGTVLANISGGSAAPSDVGLAAFTAALPDFVASGAGHKKGLVPDPGAVAGTTKFLREDATWVVPSATVADADYTDITVSSSGTVWTIDNDAVTFAKLQNSVTGQRVLGAGSSGINYGELSVGDLLDWLSTTQGAILTRAVSAWTTLNPGTTQKVLTSQGAAADLVWQFVTEAMQLLADNTTCNVTTSAHGYAPKAPGDAFKFLNGASPPAWTYLDNIIILRDEKTQNTAGGTFTSGAWRTRDLNVEARDGPNSCTLSSNQFTLTAGTYEIDARAPAFYVDPHQARLQNVTAGTTLLVGTSEYSGVGTAYSVTPSVIRGVFTIAASQALEIQHRCATTNGTFGFGNPANLTTEVYTIVVLRRLA